MVNDTKACLLVFVKNPQLGQVKTRLAATIGEMKALEVYKRLLGITKRAIDPVNVQWQIWYNNYITADDHWSASGYTKHVQKGKNLGIRMQHAFREAFKQGFEKVLIIGSDCAEITSNIIRKSYDKLETNQVVIGPSEDGGYYLLGMTRFIPELFVQKDWSTSVLYQQTVAQLNRMGYSYAKLRELNDVDNKEDLKASSLYNA